MADLLDWADQFAIDIIAEVHGSNFMDARKAIAARLRDFQKMEAEAAAARIRLAWDGAPDDDAQFDADIERREGWTVDG